MDAIAEMDGCVSVATLEGRQMERMLKSLTFCTGRGGGERGLLGDGQGIFRVRIFGAQRSQESKKRLQRTMMLDVRSLTRRTAGSGGWEGEVMVVRSGRPGGVTGCKAKGGFSQVELWESEGGRGAPLPASGGGECRSRHDHHRRTTLTKSLQHGSSFFLAVRQCSRGLFIPAIKCAIEACSLLRRPEPALIASRIQNRPTYALPNFACSTVSVAHLPALPLSRSSATPDHPFINPLNCGVKQHASTDCSGHSEALDPSWDSPALSLGSSKHAWTRQAPAPKGTLSNHSGGKLPSVPK